MQTPSLAFCSMSWYMQYTGDNDVSLNFQVLHHETTLDSQLSGGEGTDSPICTHLNPHINNFTLTPDVHSYGLFL